MNNPIRHLTGLTRPVRRRVAAAAGLLAVLLTGTGTVLILATHQGTGRQPILAPPTLQRTASSTPSASTSTSSPTGPGRTARRTPAGTSGHSSAATAAPTPDQFRHATAQPSDQSVAPSMASPIRHASLTSAPATHRPAPRPTTHAPSPVPSPHGIGSGGLVGSVNAVRTNNGVNELAESDPLTEDAKACALRMARASQVEHCGGNQVVAGAWSTGGCMSGFENDAAHRGVLLSTAYASAGSGVAVDAAGAYYCVINFE